jgi:hypothetical protein
MAKFGREIDAQVKGLVANHLLGKALVAQRIEQEPSNLLAAGSIPAEGTDKSRMRNSSLGTPEAQVSKAKNFTKP